MIHHSVDIYTNSGIVSRDISNKSRKGIRAPTPRFPAFVANMNKFYELCGSNESEAARRLGVKAALFHRWRTGENTPAPLSRPTIATILGVSTNELMHGTMETHETPLNWQPSMSRRDQKTLDEVKALLLSADEKIVNHLRDQIELLSDLNRRRQERDIGAPLPQLPDDIDFENYELKTEK